MIAELDPEDALARLAPALAVMRSAVKAHGGIVSEELGDGLLALFGAPRADENHAVQACLAGLTLLHRIKALGDPDLQVRIGIHSGYAVTRFKAADLTRVYGAAGPAVHLVSRLQSAASPGTILASSSCHELAAGYIQVRSRAPVRLKGFSDEVPVHEVIGVTSLSSWRVRELRCFSRFVGRKDEGDVLVRAAEKARGGHGQAVALTGDSGIGKSRAAHEFTSALSRSGWPLIEASCDRSVHPAPYSLLKRLLRAASEAKRGADRGRSRDAEVSALNGTGFHDAANAAIMDRPINDPAWTLLDPSVRRRLIADAAGEAIKQAVGTNPMVLLIEDMHWSDEESSAVIESFLSLLDSRPLLLLLTSRPEGEPSWFARQPINRLRLGPLSPESARILLDTLLGHAESLDRLKTMIQQHTGGVPLFIEEVVRRMVDTGILKGSVGCYQLASTIDNIGIPPTIQAVVAARIDRLTPDGKELLQIASVVGRQISARLLSEVIGVPDTSLFDRLVTLENAQFLVATAHLSESDYEFSHDLLREVSYDSILRDKRTGFHQRVFHALEKRFAEGDLELAETLTHHAVSGAYWPKVEHYALFAARKSMGNSTFSHAARHFKIAMDAIDRDTRSPEREVRAIDVRIEARAAYMPLGRFDQWLKLAADAELRAASIGDAHREVAASVSRAGAMNFVDAPSEAIEAGESAVQKAERLGHLNYLSVAEYALGQAYYAVGRFRHAERLLARPCMRLNDPQAQVLLLSRASGLRVLCLMMKSAAHAWLGEFGLAEEHCLEAERIAAATARPYDVVAGSYARGVAAVFRGNTYEAVSVLERALETCEKNELRTFAPVVANQLGQAYLQQHLAGDAHGMLRRAIDGANAISHTITRAAATAHLAMALLQLGELKEARDMAQVAQTNARQLGYQGIEVQALCVLASVLAAEGTHKWREAKEVFGVAIELATNVEARPCLAAVRLSFSRALTRNGDIEEGRIQLESYERLRAEMGLQHREEMRYD